MTTINLNDNWPNLPALSVTESWGRTCTILNDGPLSAAYWRLEDVSGEKFLDELPDLQVDIDQFILNRN
jgi:hypothetical protein